MKRLRGSPPSEVESRSWHRLWLEVLATDHPILCHFLVLIGVFGGGMISLMFGMGLVIASYESAFGNMAHDEGPMFPLIPAFSLTLALGVTRLSVKAMAPLGEIMGRSTQPPASTHSESAKPPALWDRDLDEAF